MAVATGFDFEPLPDGNVLIEFFGDDGRAFKKQIVTPGVMRSMGLVSAPTSARDTGLMASPLMTSVSLAWIGRSWRS